MTICAERIEELLTTAGQNHAALGELLECYRPYLELKARQWMTPRTVARCAPVDIVQQTYADVVRDFAQFDGTDEPTFSHWLLKIHRNNANDMIRKHVVASKRSVLREQSQNGEGSSALFAWHEFASDGSTPSTRIIRGERALRLAQVLSKLSERQAQAIRLRFLDAMSICDIAQAMEISNVKVASLLKNGLRNLRDKLHEQSWQ